MIYRKLVTRGEDTIEHIIEGDYEEVLALFTELEAKDAVEYQVNDWAEHQRQIADRILSEVDPNTNRVV